mmetsp:Transcript_21060/g.58456  ORF Transcript_21060/g.58456 Transcript_21060/m.58456 type:complete len:205 (+) Transcript_21060:591-1205(+)
MRRHCAGPLQLYIAARPPPLPASQRGFHLWHLRLYPSKPAAVFPVCGRCPLLAVPKRPGASSAASGCRRGGWRHPRYRGPALLRSAAGQRVPEHVGGGCHCRGAGRPRGPGRPPPHRGLPAGPQAHPPRLGSVLPQGPGAGLCLFPLRAIAARGARHGKHSAGQLHGCAGSSAEHCGRLGGRSHRRHASRPGVRAGPHRARRPH